MVTDGGDRSKTWGLGAGSLLLVAILPEIQHRHGQGREVTRALAVAVLDFGEDGDEEE